MDSRQPSGFSLIEVCIALVVIALMIGGFIAGQSLIRASQVRNATGDLAKYTQAFMNFQNKYHALPGDYANAASQFGLDASGGGCTANTYSATLKRATCNGDGKGKIGLGYLVASGTTTQDYEVFRAWQQLSDSGFYNGSTDSAFNGISGSASSLNPVIGINVPASSIPGGGYTMLFQNSPSAGDIYHFSYIYNHALVLGAATNSNATSGALLTPAEMFAIDQKMDDGIPGTGVIQPVKSSNCANSSTAYRSDVTVAGCALIYITNF